LALSIGSVASPVPAQDALSRARQRAALLPDLLVEAQRISSTIVTGDHGRKKRGIGDTFWQFRPYDQSESLSRIDWRRSARDDVVTVRDKEWEAAHTVWVWADNSASMLYQSELADVSKQSRAVVLALALTDVLARSGERVGWPGLTRPLSSRNSAERIAAELAGEFRDQDVPFPDTTGIARRSELVVISDFLEPMDVTLERISTAARAGITGTLIQIVDPAEETFPYSGRTEFRDPETNNKMTFGRAESLADDYRNIFSARQQTLSERCTRLGWSHLVHHTDQLASTVLVSTHLRLSGLLGASR